MDNRSHNVRYVTGLALLVATLVAIAPVNSAFAQAEQQPSEQDVAMHYSLYWEDFKNQNFESALPNLKWILDNAPGFPNENDRNFRRAIDAYEALAENDPSYLDSALVVFDEVVPTLESAGIEVDQQRWLINRGRFIQTHSDYFDNAQAQVAEAYQKAYELNPESLDAYYVNFLISELNARGDEAATLEFMEQVEETHGENEEVADYIAKVRDSLFDTPEERIAFLESQMERRPDDVELVSELFDLYMRAGDRQKASQLSERLLESNPSARTYEMVARMRLEDGEEAEAFSLYERALEMSESEDRQRDILFNMGIAQQQMGRLSNARTYFKRALDIDPSFGPAYIAIGDLYVTQVGNCGSFERQDRAVYWLAVDYYERAANRDESVANQARQKASSYRGSFPSAEDLFYEGWDAGDRYNVNYGCYSWISETTTVRRR